MNFWRAIAGSLLSLVCTLAVSAYVTLQTLETTILNRTEVKSWLDKSGVYDNLLSTFLNTNQTAQQELSGNSVVSDSDAKSALNQTFNATYVKQSAETALDSTYNWLEGRSSDINFTVNTPDKREAFIGNLTAVLEPQIAALPQCTSATQVSTSNPTCIPPGTNAGELANDVATDTANQSGLFTKPISSDTLLETSSSTEQSNATTAGNQVRDVVSNLRSWLLWLPVIALVSGALVILLALDKLKAAKHLAGRLTFGLLFTCAAGLVIASIGQDISFKGYLSGTNSVVVSQVIEPVLHQAAPAIGYRLAWVSGVPGAVTLVAWIVLLVIKKRRDQAALLAAPKEDVLTPKSTQPANNAKPVEPDPAKPADTPTNKS